MTGNRQPSTLTALTELPRGTKLLVGGDCWLEVPDAICERFAPGDAVVVADTGDAHAPYEALLIPARERERARIAVDRALAAFEVLRGASEESIASFYEAFASLLEQDAVWQHIAETNQADVADAEARGRSTTRLLASPTMRRAMIDGLRGWQTAPTRRDQVIERVDHDGFRIELLGAPLGVVAFVFEGRPNVLADATGVLRSGNAAVLRIGRDALRTARAIVTHALEPALRASGLPEGSVVLVDSDEHASGWALFCDSRVSLAVARGSGPAVAALGSLARKAGVPVSLHGTGGAWVIASHTTPADALEHVVLSSLDRKVCNTLNTLCLPRARASELCEAALRGFERAGRRLGHGFKLHVVEGSEAFVPAPLFTRPVDVARAHGVVREMQAERLPENDLGREWEWEQTPEVTLVVVDDVAHAVSLFNRYSPQFIASLLSEDQEEHARFYANVNAPFVGDAGTRWVDGQRALLRPELGLSNWQFGRLFARGGILTGDGVLSVRTRCSTTSK